MDDRWWFSSLAHRLRRDARGDGGFSLIEVIVALVVMALVLGSVAYAIGLQVSTIGSARNEQAGQGLLTKALNEIRAMPYTDVQRGLTTTTTTTTTFITRATTTWTFKCTGQGICGTLTGLGETIPHSSVTPKPPAPYHPQRTSANTVNGVMFTISTIPTKYVNPNASPPVTGTTGVMRVTVVVSWGGQAHGSATTLVGQTVVYSPTASGSSIYTTAKNPFAAPYEPNFTGSASAGIGSITVTDVPTSTATPIPGVSRTSFTSLSLSLTGAHSYSSFVQTSSVVAWARSTGAALAGTTNSSAGTLVTTGASTDASSPNGAYQHQSMTTTTSATSVVLKGSDGSSITATPSGGDTGSAVSTAFAAATQDCADLSGTNLTTLLPCGSSGATESPGTAPTTPKGNASIAANIAYQDKTVVSGMKLATVTGSLSTRDRAFSARHSGSAATATCTALRSHGCITAEAQMSLGSVTLGGLPPLGQLPKSDDPPGWTKTKNLLSLHNYSAEVSSSAKSGSTPTLAGHVTGTYVVPANGATSPVLTYYDGSGYKQIVLNGTTQTLTIPSVTTSRPFSTGVTATFTMSATLKVNGYSSAVVTSFTATPSTWLCTISCRISESVGAPVSGFITFMVKVGTAVIANFQVTVDLGSVSTRTTFQEPS